MSIDHSVSETLEFTCKYFMQFDDVTHYLLTGVIGMLYAVTHLKLYNFYFNLTKLITKMWPIEYCVLS